MVDITELLNIIPPPYHALTAPHLYQLLFLLLQNIFQRLHLLRPRGVTVQAQSCLFNVKNIPELLPHFLPDVLGGNGSSQSV